MTSRERVLNAFNHCTVDRVPINYQANAGVDGRLRNHFGLDPEDGEGLLLRLKVDFRGIVAPYVGPCLHREPSEEGVRISPDWGLRTRYIEHDTGGYWEPWPGRLADLDQEAAEKYPMPSPDDYDYGAVADYCREHADFAIGAFSQFEVMNWTARHVGDERMYIGLALDDQALMTFIRRFVEIKLEILRRTIVAAGGNLGFIGIGEDLGTQRGPRISLDMFREKIRPIHQPFIDLAHRHNLLVMIHSCGSCSWAFNDFIDMGIAAVDTLQPEAKDMAPVLLKQRYGDKLAFHGCISTAGPVAHGSVEETIEYCRRTLEVMMPGSGYCFAPTHCLQDNSPTENVLAMYRVAQEAGVY